MPLWRGHCELELSLYHACGSVQQAVEILCLNPLVMDFVFSHWRRRCLEATTIMELSVGMQCKKNRSGCLIFKVRWKK